MAALALVAAGCEPAAAPAQRNQAAVRRVERPKPDVSPASAAPARIDPPPADDSRPEIVERGDIEVNGEPACAFTVRYEGAVDQPVTWNKEPCAAVTTRFLSLRALRDLGRVERLSPETLADLERPPRQPILYIESEFTASIYPLNSAGRVYEVPVAD